VQGEEIGDFKSVLHHLVFPRAEGRHETTRRAAGRKLNSGIYPLHDFRSLLRDAPILARGFLANLPWAIHFVAEAPELHGVRFSVTVRDSKVTQACASWMVAVLEVLSCLVGAPRSQVHTEHRFGLRQFAPLDKFVGSESVRLRTEPREIESHWSLPNRTNPILPVIARHEISSGITDD